MFQCTHQRVPVAPKRVPLERAARRALSTIHRQKVSVLVFFSPEGSSGSACCPACYTQCTGARQHRHTWSGGTEFCRFGCSCRTAHFCLRAGFLCVVQHVYPIMKFLSVYLRTFTPSGFLSMWLPSFAREYTHTQEDKAFLAHFCNVTTVKKTYSDTFFRCMVLNAS